MIAYVSTWLFVFAVPWQNVLLISGVGTISKLLGIVAIGMTLLAMLLRGQLRSLTAFHGAVLAYLCWVLLSTFWAVATKDSVENKLAIYVQNIAMMWMVWEMTPTRRRLMNLLQAYVLGTYVAAGSTIFNYLTGVGFSKAATRYAAEGFDPNDLGMLLVLALPIAWYIASKSTRAWQRWLNRGYFVFGMLAMLLTGSRGALVAAVVALAVVPWTLTQLRQGVRIAAIVIMVGAGAAAMVFVPTASFKRLSTTTSEISGGSLNSRLRIWQAGLEAVPRRPLQGYGPQSFYIVTHDRLGEAVPSHNTYLSVLVEEGMIGLILFLAIFVIVFRGLRVLPTFERRVGLIQFATLMIAILPLPWEVHKATWLTLALLAGWATTLAHAPVPVPASPRPARLPRWPARPIAPTGTR